MRRSHELKSLIQKQKLAIEKLAKLHELNILKIGGKVKKYLSSISDNSIDDIYVNFSETNVEIGLNDLRFGTSASLLPPSYLRNNWELNHGTVGGVDKDSRCLDKIILLGIIESEVEVKKLEFINNSFIKNGGIENEKRANIYVKKTSRWSSYVKKIKFHKVTEKTITAEYIFSDGSWVKYRGDKGFVLRNCRTIYKKNYDIV